MSPFRPTVVALTLLTSLFAPAALAAIPGGDDPKAYTQHDLLRAELDFNKRTLAGAYNAVGDRNPMWDDAAVKFLDAMAVYFTYGPAQPIYKTVDPPTHEALAPMARTLADAGCTDPLVTYCRAAILVDSGQRGTAMPLLRSCVAELPKRKYPANRVAAALNRAVKTLPDGEQYRAALWEASLAEADAPAVPSDLRKLAHGIDFDDLPLARKRDFCQALEARKTADPWIVNLLWGRYEVLAAWEARGTGTANTVTEAGWRGLYEHLTLARDRYTKAHALHPEFPEAAAGMIGVAMGAGDRLNTAPREWFDKAARAQLDYYPAYDSYAYSIWPRWGGSFKAMFEFGIECMETGRYADTYVPYQLWRYVLQINADSTGDFAILRDPEVQVAVHQLFTNMGQRAGGRQSRDFYPSILAAIKWRVGDYPAAAKMLDKLGDRVDPAGFRQLAPWPEGAISEVRAMNTPHAQALTAAQDLGKKNDYAAAEDAYRAVEEKLGKGHAGYLFVHHGAATMRVQREFATGQWVTITPDESLAPWAAVTGQWRHDADGSTVGLAPGPRGRAALVCHADLGTDYEFRARCWVADPKLPSVPSLFVRWVNADWYMSGAFDTVPPSTIHARTAKGDANVPFAFKGGELLCVRVEGTTLTVTVDGKPVLTDQPAIVPPPEKRSFVALGIDSSGYGRTARFTDVQVRRLGAPDGGEVAK